MYVVCMRKSHDCEKIYLEILTVAHVFQQTPLPPIWESCYGRPLSLCKYVCMYSCACVFFWKPVDLLMFISYSSTYLLSFVE
jgi:hypothetical protein